VLDGGLIDFAGKADPEDEAYLATVRNRQTAVNTRVQTQVDWDKFLKGIPEHLSNIEIAQFLLEPKLNSTIQNAISANADIKTMAIELVSTPEYQLC
jgi:ribosomal protein L22